MNKTLGKTTIIFLISLMAISGLASVNAVTYDLSAVVGASQIDAGAYFYCTTPDNGWNSYGQTFTPFHSGYLTKIQVYLAYNGVAEQTGTMVMKIYNASSLNSYPTNTGTFLKETSDVVEITGLINATGDRGNYQKYTIYDFDFNGTTYIEAGKYYAWALSILTSTTESVDLCFLLGVDATGSPYTGYGSQRTTTTWATVGDDDFAFAAYTYPIDINPTPTPTQDYKWDANTQTWYYWNGTAWVPSNAPVIDDPRIEEFETNFFGYLVPLIFLLAPAGAGAIILGRYKAAKWGFIAGLNLGAILCYLYISSFGVWAILMIIIVDVIIVFASVRGN